MPGGHNTPQSGSLFDARDLGGVNAEDTEADDPHLLMIRAAWSVPDDDAEPLGTVPVDEAYTLADHGSSPVVVQGESLSGPENLDGCRVLIPARGREEIDWASANRVVAGNGDFRDYLQNVLNYLQTGSLMKRLWDAG